MNILFDLNILLDLNSLERLERFSSSKSAFDYCRSHDDVTLFISSSSLDNFEFISTSELKKMYSDLNYKQCQTIAHKQIKELLQDFKIAKTPAYLEIDYEDIEDSQIIASAMAIDAKVITRDEKMLAKHPNIAIHPIKFTPYQAKNNSIDFASLQKQYFIYQPELELEMDKVLNNASYIMGDAVTELEQSLETFTGAKHAITCSNGTDALLLAMMALDIKPGDEIITTPFTFIATAETIAFLGATPVFVDIDEKTYNIDASKIEAKITPKTKAIIPVSLYGQPADMDAIQAIATKHDLKVIIDGAQSFGSTYKGKTDSNLGDISTTSFFPAKPLGCFGDGGAVFTNDDALAEKMRSLRLHGQSKRYHHKYIGMGGRLDTLQAAVLNVKLKHYGKDLKLRQEVAKKYDETLSKALHLPFVTKDVTSSYAQYSIRVQDRDAVQERLKQAGIPTAVHYPLPLHLQECFEYLGYRQGDFPISETVANEIMSLPMNPYVLDEEIAYIATFL